MNKDCLTTALCLLVLSVVHLDAQEEKAPPQNNRIVYRIKIDKRFVELTDVINTAEAHIKGKDAKFERANFKCNFWIDPESNDKFIVITFYTRIGQPGYRVYFSRAGNISDFWSGIMHG